MSRLQPEAVPSKAPVGVPKAERALTDALAEAASAVMSPGRGRRLIVLSEVELGMGRPDAVLLSTSPPSLTKRLQTGLRLRTLTEARVLVDLFSRASGNGYGISTGHYRQVVRDLERRGWVTPEGRAEARKTTIAKSLLIEAKVGDWRGGVLQAIRNSRLFHATALLVPERLNAKIPRPIIEQYALGLLLFDGDEIWWQRRGRERKPPHYANLWLAELAVRHIEAGLPYAGLSSDSNSAKAAR